MKCFCLVDFFFVNMYGDVMSSNSRSKMSLTCQKDLAQDLFGNCKFSVWLGMWFSPAERPRL